MPDDRYEWETSLISTVTLIAVGVVFALAGWFIATHDWGRMPRIADVSRLWFGIAYLFWALGGLDFAWATFKYVRSRKESDNA